MPDPATEDDLCQAILTFLTEGALPESENIVAAEFLPDGVPNQLILIAKAREEVEGEICTFSKQSASHVDGWISQARRLHADIEQSRRTAREIVMKYEKAEYLRGRVADASSKVGTLQNEVAFNQTLTENLKEILHLDQQLASAEIALNNGQVTSAIDMLEATESLIAGVSFPLSSHVSGVLSEKASALRKSFVASLHKTWDFMVRIDRKLGMMIISSDSPDCSSDLEHVVAAFAKLKAFDSIIESFQSDFYTYILNPVLLCDDTKTSHVLSVKKDCVCVSSHPSKLGLCDVLDSLFSALKYLQERLPSTVTGVLSAKLLPKLISTLISRWLSPAIPISLAGMGTFQVVLEHTVQFAQDLDDIGWHGTADLVSWVEQVPRLWLDRRLIGSLDSVRLSLSGSQGNMKRVERVEKENISRKDDVFIKSIGDDDWNAGWASGDEENANDLAETENQNDEEDVSAWGLEDDLDISEDSNRIARQQSSVAEDNAVDDAWGWGDENDDRPSSDVPMLVGQSVDQLSEEDRRPSSPRREVTLREYYTVTDMPDCVLAILAGLVSDSKSLVQPEYAKLRVASSAPALLTLPTFVIEMFKATAPLFYTHKFKTGQMLLYNDSLYLADQLRRLTEGHPLLRLTADIETIKTFGKAAYSKEMNSQRIVLTDLLDGSQGFTNCTEQPFLGECEIAVNSTVDRIRELHKEWQGILSRSALLQSMGSLLSTAISKMILDIEDLGDISDSESQQLVKFCNHVSKLEDLFLSEDQLEHVTGPQSASIPMTAIYVRNWLKFQYLTNILESSLADIKYLWTEGELKLEFSAEEVIDLIKALFTDSDHRKRAIIEIRRSSRMQ